MPEARSNIQEHYGVPRLCHDATTMAGGVRISAGAGAYT